MKRISLLIAAFCVSASLSAADRDSTSTAGWNFDLRTSVRAAAGTWDYLPFYARTGEEGILPLTSGGLLQLGATVDYVSKSGWFFKAEGDFAGSLSAVKPYSPQLATACIKRLYVSGGWKMLHMDLGIAPRQRELGDLSITGGNVIWSGNAPNMPGINLWSDWIYFEKGHWVGIRGNYAHYHMFDKRIVMGTMVHNKSLALKFALGRNVDFMLGLDHWAQWGGTSATYGKFNYSFKDYIRIVLGMSGGSGALQTDQLNALGNHLGREFVRFVWRNPVMTLTYQYDKPFEDGSGMRLQNYPDGVRSLHIALNKRDGLITDLMYEFANTTWQSGRRHDRPATEEEMEKQDPNDFWYGKVIIGGCDGYFNNSVYGGWTHYGRTIGCPLFLPAPPDENGICKSVLSTRFMAHHLGIKGNIYIPYTLKLTFSRYIGNYNNNDKDFFYDGPYNLALALDLNFDRFMGKLPLTLDMGLYADIGTVYKPSFGASLKFGFRKAFKKM